ncbi:hypothetical protein B0H34DRAFT_684686 [Crassisporium funariophilum]|nr:hypothetical protein B0H34DRAFT_684686 [Crassisporium funariophilum]
MFPKVFITAFSALLIAVAVTAAPQPTPVVELEERQIDGIISAITGAGGSVATQITSLGGVVGSGALSVGNDITSLGGNLFGSVTSIGGVAYTVISSKGGDAITLAASGAGVVTTKFGSVYTVATGAVGSAVASNNAAVLPYSSMQTPLLVGIVTVMLSTLLGAVITL